MPSRLRAIRSLMPSPSTSSGPLITLYAFQPVPTLTRALSGAVALPAPLWNHSSPLSVRVRTSPRPSPSTSLAPTSWAYIPQPEATGAGVQPQVAGVVAGQQVGVVVPGEVAGGHDAVVDLPSAAGPRSGTGRRCAVRPRRPNSPPGRPRARRWRSRISDAAGQRCSGRLPGRRQPGRVRRRRPVCAVVRDAMKSRSP